MGSPEKELRKEGGTEEGWLNKILITSVTFVCVTCEVQRVLTIQIRVKLRSFSFVLLSEHDQSAFLVRFPVSFDPSLEEFFGCMECRQIGFLKEKAMDFRGGSRRGGMGGPELSKR